MPAYRSFAQHLDPAAGPKRILSLDGGGLRGVLTLQVLRRIEALLRERFDDPKLRLADYFDLVAGTSTGAIIAAGLALGMSVDELERHYLALGAKVFKRSFWRLGLTQEKYDADAVADALRAVYGGEPLKRGDFATGLLVVAKRMDSGSTWVLTNNPQAKYFGARQGSTAIPNGDYPLWQVVRASTAAPTFFAPERIRIHAEASGRDDVDGLFVDGGVSPHNNPSLQALMAATMQGYRFGWKPGAERLLLVSVGTGKADPRIDLSPGWAQLPAAQALLALKGLMEDCSDLVETMMQWLSSCDAPRRIDAEMGTADPVLGGSAMLTYRRWNALFQQAWFRDVLGRDVDEAYLRKLQAMDDPSRIDDLRDVGRAVAALVKAGDFPAAFDAGVRG